MLSISQNLQASSSPPPAVLSESYDTDATPVTKNGCENAAALLEDHCLALSEELLQFAKDVCMGSPLGDVIFDARYGGNGEQRYRGERRSSERSVRFKMFDGDYDSAESGNDGMESDSNVDEDSGRLEPFGLSLQSDDSTLMFQSDTDSSMYTDGVTEEEEAILDEQMLELQQPQGEDEEMMADSPNENGGFIISSPIIDPTSSEIIGIRTERIAAVDSFEVGPRGRGVFVVDVEESDEEMKTDSSIEKDDAEDESATDIPDGSTPSPASVSPSVDSFEVGPNSGRLGIVPTHNDMERGDCSSVEEGSNNSMSELTGIGAEGISAVDSFEIGPNSFEQPRVIKKTLSREERRNRRQRWPRERLERLHV